MLTNIQSWWLMLLELYELVCWVKFIKGKVTWWTLLIYQARQGSMIDKFVMDIKSYTSSVSGCTSPLAIIMIGVTCSVSLRIHCLSKVGFFTWLHFFDMGHCDFVGCRCWPETYHWKVRWVFSFPLLLFFIFFEWNKIVPPSDSLERPEALGK